MSYETKIVFFTIYYLEKQKNILPMTWKFLQTCSILISMSGINFDLHHTVFQFLETFYISHPNSSTPTNKKSCNSK